MDSIQLTEENERFVEGELAEGTYRSRDELMNDALTQLCAYRSLMPRVEEGTEQLRNGQFLEVDAVGLKEFFDDVKEQGRKRAQLRQQPS